MSDNQDKIKVDVEEVPPSVEAEEDTTAPLPSPEPAALPVEVEAPSDAPVEDEAPVPSPEPAALPVEVEAPSDAPVVTTEEVVQNVKEILSSEPVKKQLSLEEKVDKIIEVLHLSRGIQNRDLGELLDRSLLKKIRQERRRR